MRKIIRLTESDLTRIVRRVLKEAKEDETQYHRYREGADPGIETFLADPMNEETADELQHQLDTDKYAKGPEALRKTNIGKGTGKLFIFFNGQKKDPTGFIDQIQEDAAKGYCHTIKTYEYNNRILLSTKITITTSEVECKKTTTKTPVSSTIKPAKVCKFNKKIVRVDDIIGFQSMCIRKKIYYAEYTDGTRKDCDKVDGLIGCCTATCYAIDRGLNR